MDTEGIASLCWAVTKVQALVKAVELSQRGLETEQSREIAMCMRAAHQELEWVHSELARERAAASTMRVFRRT